MNFRTLTLSAATVALMATGALAQNTTAQPTTTAPMQEGAATTTTTTTSTTMQTVKFVSNVGADQMVVSKLMGTAVNNPAGEKLGDINDVVIDKEGKPDVIVVGVGGFLGMGEKNVGVPFDSLTFSMKPDSNTRVAQLDATKESLKAAPTFIYPEDSANLEDSANPPAVRTQ